LLRRNAFQAEVAYERKQEAKKRAEAEAARQKKQAEARLRKAMLEAAFDGDLEQLKALLAEGKPVFDDAVRVHSHCLYRC
jgi:hypothetical protein